MARRRKKQAPLKIDRKPKKRNGNFWKTKLGQSILKFRREQADWSRLDTWD